MTSRIDIVSAVFNDHLAADVAVGKLIDDGFGMRHFSVVGKGYRTDEKIVGFYYAGNRMKFWGKYGVFWEGSGVSFF